MRSIHRPGAVTSGSRPCLTAEEVEDFVERLARAWRSSDAQQWADLYEERFDGVQPLMPDLRGREDGVRRAARMFRAFPDLTCEIRRWTTADTFLYVEYTVSVTVGGRKLSWAALDRYLLREGLAVQRVSYYDGLGLLLKFLKRPRGWPRLAWSRLRPALRDPITDFVERHP